MLGRDFEHIFLADRLYQNKNIERPLAFLIWIKIQTILQSRFTQDASSDPQRQTMLNSLRWELNKVLNGIFGIFGKTQNFLTGNRIAKLPWKRDSLKFKHKVRDVLPVCCEFGKSYVWAANANQPGACWVLSPFKPNYKVCLVCSFVFCLWKQKRNSRRRYGKK